ncbi:LysR substrate-binding domain-containing protein [Oryzomicrobium sp.]|uniref:LysR substrate-binding domain-containing protein n=1 Tax=Oryzomicrobium sp. TaxID=1911578 RepID=UPI0025FD80A5|nr:LysR substrate-binding domain-containing protein [Oryzomicrobium sp.]
MKPLPPLKSLVAFDAVMRSNSFSVAAAELSVTPGAIGQQIQKLEAWLGAALFIRQVRAIHPTPEALAYWARIQPALAQIADASQKLRDSRSAGVWLSMPPSFAAKWFTARMAGLLTAHPGLQLHLNATAALVDFEREAIDLAIRYFDGNDHRLETARLYDDEARVYCAPGYAAALAMAAPADAARASLLVTTMHAHWERWLARFAGLGGAQAMALPRIHFDQSLTAIEAARQGQGLVLTSPLLVREEVAAGTLVEPFDCPLPLVNGYYLVHPRTQALRPAAAAVKAWFIAEAGRDAGT